MSDENNPPAAPNGGVPEMAVTRAEFAALQNRVAELFDRLDAAPAPQSTPGEAPQIAALQTALDVQGAQIAELASRFNALCERQGWTKRHGLAMPGHEPFKASKPGPSAS